MKNNYRTNKQIFAITLCILVVVAVAVPVGVHMVRSSSDEPIDTSQGVFDETTGEPSDSETMPEETTGEGIETEPVEPDNGETNEVSHETNNVSHETNDTSEDTTDSDTSTTSSKPVDTTAPAEETTSKPVETTKPDKETTNKPDDTTSPSEATTSRPVVKQVADRETGISWDGISPIIYTYPDGTTGTEIRVGATYEALPGRFITVTKYHMPEDPSETTRDLSVCSHCGKKGGDGTNGTCLRYWTGGDHICEHCGTTIPVKTCHTCNS